MGSMYSTETVEVEQTVDNSNTDQDTLLSENNNKYTNYIPVYVISINEKIVGYTCDSEYANRYIESNMQKEMLESFGENRIINKEIVYSDDEGNAKIILYSYNSNSILKYDTVLSKYEIIKVESVNN